MMPDPFPWAGAPVSDLTYDNARNMVKLVRRLATGAVDAVAVDEARAIMRAIKVRQLTRRQENRRAKAREARG